jgi:hypothetical protein
MEGLMAKSASTKGRKGKIGKKKGWIAAYYSSGRPLFNKARRIKKHIARYGKYDESANEALLVAIAGMPRSLSKQFDNRA